MNDQKPKNGIDGNVKEWKAKEPEIIPAVWGLGKAQPAKCQWKGDAAGQNHTPEYALMRQPAVEATPANKLLRQQVGDDCLGYKLAVPAKIGEGEKQSPAPTPVPAGRGARQPEGVLVGDRGSSENGSHRIADKRGLKPMKT